MDPGGRPRRLQNFGLIFRFEIFERADGFAFEVVARLDRAVFIGNWHRVARDASNSGDAAPERSSISVMRDFSRVASDQRFIE